MVDATLQAPSRAATTRKPGGLRRWLARRSTIAFLMALPLILMIAVLVIYPAFYSIHLATLNKSMERFVGFDNFTFLFKRETFWMVVQQSCIFAITAVIFKALIGCGCSTRPTARSTGSSRCSAPIRCRGPATPTGRGSR
jgi:multiple sugar transport system permease protein